MADTAAKKKSTSKGDKKSSKSSKGKSKDAAQPAAPTSKAVEPQAPSVDKLPTLPVQRDWAQREWIEHVSLDLKKITEFLNRFGKQ